jgi:hypothetical protein
MGFTMFENIIDLGPNFGNDQLRLTIAMIGAMSDGASARGYWHRNQTKAATFSADVASRRGSTAS